MERVVNVMTSNKTYAGIYIEWGHTNFSRVGQCFLFTKNLVLILFTIHLTNNILTIPCSCIDL